MIEANAGGIMVTGAEDIELFRLIALKGALKLENMGMRRRGRSALSIAKEFLGVKGTRASVLAALVAEIDKRKAAR